MRKVVRELPVYGKRERPVGENFFYFYSQGSSDIWFYWNKGVVGIINGFFINKRAVFVGVIIIGIGVAGKKDCTIKTKGKE